MAYKSEYFDSTLLLILHCCDLRAENAMISLKEIKKNSEQLADCTARVEQMLIQLTATEA